MLTFDDATHTYYWNGKRVPGVTSILQALHNFDGVPANVLEAAQDRGTAVHLCCEYLDKGILDEDSVDPSITGYVDGWRRFTADLAPEWSHIEEMVYHRVLRYAGTVDRVGTIRGTGYVLDIKTSVAAHPVWGLQTAAYANAIEKQSHKRATVQLRSDGTYRLIEWDDPSDWPTFCSLLTVRNFLERHK